MDLLADNCLQIKFGAIGQALVEFPVVGDSRDPREVKDLSDLFSLEKQLGTQWSVDAFGDSAE